MTKLLVPILLVLLALMLVPRDAQAPAVDFSQGVRLLGYELRLGVSLQPVATLPPVAAPVSDSVAVEVVEGEVAR